jgi:LemA protein
MKSLKNPVIIAVIIVLLLALIGGGQYNKLVNLDERVKSQWGQVENQFQRRADLVPNLVNTVKGYAAHESSVLIAVTEARSRVGSAQTVQDKINANADLTSALSRLLVVVEKYPDLKANQNFLDLQAQLEGTENRIAQERRKYNEVVMEFNQTIRGIPGVFIAKMMGLKLQPFFKAEEGAQKAPEVKF